jgi:hypothetical protein
MDYKIPGGRDWRSSEPPPGDEDLPPYDPTAAFVTDLPPAEIIAGHLDIGRELLDGQTGLGAR